MDLSEPFQPERYDLTFENTVSEEKAKSPTPQPPEVDDDILPSPQIDDIVIPEEEYISFPKADTSASLFVGASVTTFQAISILMSWFSSFPGISKSAFSRLLFILQHFILPEGNNLPDSYDKAYDLIKPFLSPAKQYHCCINDCVVYRNSNAGEYEGLSKCPVCNEERYEAGTMIPRKQFKYISVATTLRRLFGNSSMSKLLQDHVSKTGNNIVSSIHQSKGWKAWYSSEGVFKGDHRGLAFAICTDGLNPYAHEKTTYSMWPIFLVPLNLPHHVRMKVGSMLLTGIIPGPKEPNDLDPYMDIVVDDIMDLSKLTVFDAFKNEYFQPQANILLHILDYPGQNKVFRDQGTAKANKVTDFI